MFWLKVPSKGNGVNLMFITMSVYPFVVWMLVCLKNCTNTFFLLYKKVKYVKSSSFYPSTECTQSPFYHYNQNKLVLNKL